MTMTPEETQRAKVAARDVQNAHLDEKTVRQLAQTLASAVLALADELAAANATINTKLHLSDLTEQQQYDDEQGRQVLPQAIRFPGEVLKEWELSLDDITSRETELLDAAMVAHVRELRRLMGTGRITLVQQPEPVTDAPHVGDFYNQFCREVEAQHIAADLPAMAVVGICTRMAHKAQRKVIERLPEPVSREELSRAIADAEWPKDSDWKPNARHIKMARILLSHYTITARAAASPTEETQ